MVQITNKLVADVAGGDEGGVFRVFRLVADALPVRQRTIGRAAARTRDTGAALGSCWGGSSRGGRIRSGEAACASSRVESSSAATCGNGVRLRARPFQNGPCRRRARARPCTARANLNRARMAPASDVNVHAVDDPAARASPDDALLAVSISDASNPTVPASAPCGAVRPPRARPAVHFLSREQDRSLSHGVHHRGCPSVPGRLAASHMAAPGARSACSNARSRTRSPGAHERGWGGSLHSRPANLCTYVTRRPRCSWPG